MKLTKRKNPTSQNLYTNRLAPSIETNLLNNPTPTKNHFLSPDNTPLQSPFMEDRKNRFSYLVQDLGETFFTSFESTSPRVTKSRFLDPQKSEVPQKIGKNLNSQLEQIDVWLEKMKETHLPELDAMMRKNLIPRSEITKKVEELYSVALKEIIKQITSQNRLRGELLEKVLKTLRYVWLRYPQHLTFLLDKEREYFEKKSQELNEKFQEKLEKYKQRCRVWQMKSIKLEEERESFIKEVGILRKSTSDYRTEVSHLMKYGIKNSESVGVQVDLDDHLRTFEQVKFSRFNSMKDISSKVKITKEDTYKDKNYSKEKLLSEILKVFGNGELSPDFDLDTLAETVWKQTGSITDWIFGFRLGFNLSEKVSVKSAPISVPKIFANKLDVSNITRKSSRSRNSRKEGTEIVPASQILRSVLVMKEETLHTYEKNTQKKVLKHILQSLYTCFKKKFSKKLALVDVLLQELINKYTIRKIAERKLKELIVGCILYSNDNTRIRMFSSAIGCGEYYKLRNFSVEGCEIYIRLYENMINSKTGIILDPSDPLMIENYPLSRANETARSIFSRVFPFEVLNTLFQLIKKMSEPDPSRINKEGVIKLDTFVDVCMNAYEDYYKSIEKGARFAAKSITEQNYITKGEAVLLFRHLGQDKKERIKELFVENNEVNIEDFQIFCLNNGALLEDDVLKFYEDSVKDWKIVEIELESYELFLGKLLNISIEGLTEEEWKFKFEEVQIMLKGRRSERGLYMWHLMKKEIDLLKGMLVLESI